MDKPVLLVGAATGSARRDGQLVIFSVISQATMWTACMKTSLGHLENN
jgi:hypothetical protein